MADDQRLLECVPNFSEGRDEKKIQAIANAIRNVNGVKLLHVDPGHAANRTVMTFAGKPEQVVEAAYQAIQTASEVIDMTRHQGEHPRMGATDVCPLIPLQNVNMDDAAEYAEQLAKKVGEELEIPVYLYEKSAKKPERKNLASVRKGGYEGMKDKLRQAGWEPDYGPEDLNEKSGVTAIGARPFLVAYNINLNTKSAKKAHEVANDIREIGKPVRDKNGKVEKDENGKAKRIPGSLKSVKAIGWYIEEYRKAQVSINVTDIEETPVHKVFEEVVQKADERGMRVTGSEVVGMVPKKVLLEAGRFYFEKQNESPDVSNDELVEMAIMSLELNDVMPFNPDHKVIEHQLRKQQP